MFRSTTIHCNFWSRSKLVPKNNERNFLRKGRRWTKAKALNKTGECRERTIQTTTRVDTLDGHFSSWTITTGGWTLLFLFFFFKRRASRIPPIRVHGGWPPWRAMIYGRPENICAWVSDCAWPEIWPNIFICERRPVWERERETQKGKMHVHNANGSNEWEKRYEALYGVFPLNR